ncbi:unnamed protein product [Danaus chrysippus]|uniref:(African queen) hypothetical protein n=1 Tax=Danaus chrysippus TaxID=151541 RepID=A0A8J2QPC4_9NEOP|nr:unnamed protein product [Danaus chrysippus]
MLESERHAHAERTMGMMGTGRVAGYLYPGRTKRGPRVRTVRARSTRAVARVPTGSYDRPTAGSFDVLRLRVLRD